MKRTALKRADFLKIASEIKPSRYLDYRDWLQELYNQIKAQPGNYSYSAFASDLGFPANNVLHHVIKGRRPLSEEAGEKIISALKLDKTEKAFLRNLIIYINTKSEKKRKESLSNMFELKDRKVTSESDKLSLEFFQKWYHPVIAELTRLEGFESDPQWIARCLNGMVRVDEIKDSMSLLEKMKLIAYDEELGRHVRTAANPSTGPQVAGLAVANFHTQMINLARESIVKVDKKERDISSLTMALDEEGFSKVKEVIHAFQDEVLALESACINPSQIVQLNFQLFPLSNKVEAKHVGRDGTADSQLTGEEQAKGDTDINPPLKQGA